MLATLRAGGVPDELAVVGQHLLLAVVNGFTLDETADVQAEDEQPPPEDIADRARDYLASLPHERFPNRVELADHFAFADPDLDSRCCSTCS